MKRDERTPDSVVEAIKEGVTEGVVEAGRSMLSWAVGGAFLGAAVLGGFGLYHLGTIGLAIGAAAGAVIGGVGSWAFYVTAM